MKTNSFDVLIIGGGITGAGIALDAAVRGLKVALIEMQDFAGGTSGRSTKLIHGGLRYLKQFEFSLVSEMGKEREIIHRNAPHLTKPEPMLLPIVKHGSLNKFSSRIGMWLYEWLAGIKKEERHKNLSIKQTLAAEPLLRIDNLLGGILFYEYQTDDARLTIEVIKEAVGRGATAINYVKADSFIYKNEIICGAKVTDQLSAEQFVINANYVVNATGPFVEEINNLDEKKSKLKLSITKGVHIVVDWKNLPVKQALYFDTYDKRMIFVIPREGKTYIGTTDTFYSGDLKDPKANKVDTDYLLKCVNNYFPGNKLSSDHIESTWAGLRPLIDEPGKKPSEISRKDEQFISASGLITIAGGKLTGYRKMAQRVVDKLVFKIQVSEDKTVPDCSTDTIKISGGKLPEGISFREFVIAKTKQGIILGLTETEAKMAVNRYGSNIDDLYSIIEKVRSEKSELPLFIRAQIIYTIENEMCLSPSDFFIRRTAMVYFDNETVRKWRVPVLKYMQAVFSWSDEMADKFDSEFERSLEEINFIQ